MYKSLIRSADEHYRAGRDVAGRAILKALWETLETGRVLTLDECDGISEATRRALVELNS